MAQDEFTLKIDRNPADIAADSTLSDAREATKAVREKATETVLHQQSSAKEDPVEKVPHEPDEDLESVDVQLPNGIVVEFGPPRDVSLTMRIIRLLGDAADSDLTAGIYRILLSVRAIDGKSITPITNTIEGEKLANRLGDTGIDILSMVMQTHWKPLRLTALPVIKKNQRKQ